MTLLVLVFLLSISLPFLPIFMGKVLRFCPRTQGALLEDRTFHSLVEHAEARGVIEKPHWCKGRLTADTLKHRKNVARKKNPWVSLHFPKNQSMDKVTSRCFSTGVLAGWVETVQQTIGAAAPFLKPQTLAYEAKEISVEHQNMLWKMIRIEIVDLHGFTH